LTNKEKSSITKNVGIFENKNKRQHTILSFINDRKSAAIKDIAALFPDISEKTIQRELGTLVALGKITKRGNKRWSLYMAVGA
jgi:DeoR/GlpR family transcriptional regulator of sugar metabolism